MSAFSAVDLSLLSAPDILETLDFETLYAERRASLVALYPADEQAAIAATLALESEPLARHLQQSCYRELLLRARINDAARAVLLPTATGQDLDNIAAGRNVKRLEITPADLTVTPPLAAVMEDDDSLRRRVQLAPEGYTTAGSEGSYLFHALSASGQVLDADASSPSPGDVVVSVLSREGDGAASAAVLAAVSAALSAEDVRPLTDRVTVVPAEIVRYPITALLTFFSGPDQSVVLANAIAAARAYATSQHKLGRDITLDGLYAALRQEGVQKVTLIEPAAEIPIARNQAPYCTAITVTPHGIDE
ncbi:baseplate J/gp47 family protein [Uliginosibacterium paludis]|uniref:Baseplate J/gp47 family protein n=1 Tax=Uliginosibacterium paludis TaxID=1615952 RepID=A0ABV2CV20_9RHOO